MMMKKQIVSCFGLCLLLLNSFSFSMQPAGENGQGQLAYDQLHAVAPAHDGQNQEEAENENGNPPGYDQLQNIIPVQNMNELAPLDREEALSIVEAFPFIKSCIKAILEERRRAQDANVPQVRRPIPFPHRFLGYGSSASGKITLFRAMATLLGLPTGIVYPAYVIDFNQPAARPSLGERIEPFLQDGRPRFLIIKHIDKINAYNRFEGDDSALTLEDFFKTAEREDRNRRRNRFFIAATAIDINAVPEGLQQFFRCIEVKNPDLNRRTMVLKSLLSSSNSVDISGCSDQTIETFTKKMEGFSFEDLKRVSTDAIYSALARAVDQRQQEEALRRAEEAGGQQGRADQRQNGDSMPQLVESDLDCAFKDIYSQTEVARKIFKEKRAYNEYSKQCSLLRRMYREVYKPAIYKQA